MGDNKEVKPKSFRIDDETAERFKQVANDIGGNQQETLSKLIEAFEFQKGKAVLTNKKEDIEKFESYITLVTRMYMSTLEDNQNITEIIRAEFSAQLNSKDSLIQDLQGKLSNVKQDKKLAEDNLASITEENIKICNNVSELKTKLDSDKQTFESTLKDKDNLNKALTDSCNDLKTKVESMTEEYQDLREKSKLLADIVLERDNLVKDNKELETKVQYHLKHEADAIEQLKLHESDMAKQLKLNAAEKAENIKQQTELENQKTILELEKKYQLEIQSASNTIEQLKLHETEKIESIIQKSELESQKAALNIEKRYQEEIQLLKETKQVEIDKYQQKYFELLEKQEKERNNKKEKQN